jgi:hypothetical protein
VLQSLFGRRSSGKVRKEERKKGRKEERKKGRKEERVSVCKKSKARMLDREGECD